MLRLMAWMVDEGDGRMKKEMDVRMEQETVDEGGNNMDGWMWKLMAGWMVRHVL